MDENNLDSQYKLPLSKLWQLQKAFYTTQNSAWVEQGSFYITGNPHIANSYANIIINFIQDCINSKQYNPIEPFYIVELGADSGIFSFYIIKRLLEIREKLGINDITFKYIMTSHKISNIELWMEHPQLQRYLERNILDFAQLDLEQDQSIYLIKAKASLNKLYSHPKLCNPAIIIANCIFNTINHDIFRIKNGQLQEGLVTIDSAAATLNKKFNSTCTEPQLTYRNCSTNYYQNDDLDILLKYYLQHYDNINLTLPIGSLRCIQRLKQITNNRLLMLTTDKGYSNYIEENGKGNSTVVYHGNFSLMVNFHAIGHYSKYTGGDFYYQPTQQQILSCAFSFGQKFSLLLETQKALDIYFNFFSLANLINIYQQILTNQKDCTLLSFLSYLNMSGWDPYIFDSYFNFILNQLDSNDAITKDLLTNLSKVAANFYYIPGGHNTLFNIGFLLQHIKKYRTAIKYYQKCIDYEIQKDIVYYNLGICYFNLNNYKSALLMFEKTIEANPMHILARGWLLKIKSKLDSLKKIPNFSITNKSMQ